MSNSDMPAMPVSAKEFNNVASCGLTKREHFAGLAMAAIISNPARVLGDAHSPEDIVKATANISLKWADALLKELEDERYE
tara:strand:+ start:1167 stop:1409 length:243 start_codon:yes stop_codon:yes gene_type:complete